MEEFKSEQVPGAAEEQAPVQAAAKKPGVQDVNGDGKVDFKDYVATAAKAAEDVYHSAAETIKEKAPEYAQKAKDAAGDVKNAFADAAAAVKEKAPEYAQKAKDAAEDVKGAFVDAAAVVKEKAPEYAQKAKDAAGDVKDAFVDAAAVVKEKAPEYAHKAKDAIVNAFDPKAPVSEATPAAAQEPPKPEDTITRI